MKLISLNINHATFADELKKFLNEQKVDTDIFLLQETSLPAAKSTINEVFDNKNWQQKHTLDTHKIPSRQTHIYSLSCLIKKPLQIKSSFSLSQSDPEIGAIFVTEFEKFTLINVHGASQPGDKLDTKNRLRQTKAITDFAIKNPRPTIIAGDFNLDPSTDSIKNIEKIGYQNLISLYKIPTTRNENAWKFYPNNKQLFADYTFVSSEIKVNDFTVPHNLASDHLPMMLEFEIAK